MPGVRNTLTDLGSFDWVTRSLIVNQQSGFKADTALVTKFFLERS